MHLSPRVAGLTRPFKRSITGEDEMQMNSYPDPLSVIILRLAATLNLNKVEVCAAASPHKPLLY
jgi:hypothetical protein